MSDPFRRVRPGEKLRIPAVTYNAIVDAAKAFAGDRFGDDAGERETRRDGAIVRVKNATGANLPRYSVLGLSAPVFTPSDSLDAFLREVAFRGVVPTSDHVGRFCITLEPAPVDRVVRAFVAGVCPVQVDVTDSTHRCALAEVGETDILVSGETGPAQILWREGDDESYGYDTGEQWAIVLFGTTCGASEAYGYDEPYE